MAFKHQLQVDAVDLNERNIRCAKNITELFQEQPWTKNLTFKQQDLYRIDESYWNKYDVGIL